VYPPEATLMLKEDSKLHSLITDFQAFKNVLEKKNMSENLHFLLSVDYLKLVLNDPNKVLNTWDRIKKTFIIQDAPLQVNIDEDLRNTLTTADPIWLNTDAFLKQLEASQLTIEELIFTNVLKQEVIEKSLKLREGSDPSSRKLKRTSRALSKLNLDFIKK
jgi:hypothetical protein